MNENADAQKRFMDLAEKLSMSSTGNSYLSRADHDEMRLLADVLGPALPQSVKRLLGENFSRSGDEQRELGERILRQIELAEQYDVQEEPSPNSDLHPTFSLEKGDKVRVLKLCSDMRKIVFSSPDFDEPHKRRLLNRIAAIEQQVHSKQGLFDVILGGVSDIGETLGKFGKDIKPLSDRMREVLQITRRATNEYDQLPAPDEVQQLPPPDDGE